MITTNFENDLVTAHRAAAHLDSVKSMLNMRIIVAFTLLAMLSLASATPHAHQGASNNEDDFWAKKPMHTTDLMAGKARTTNKPSIGHAQVPTTTPRIPTLCEETNEL